MRRRTAEEIKALILSCLVHRAVSSVTSTLPDDLDLRAEGIVDSLGFVELLSEMETRLGCRIDLDELDPELLTRVGPLARYIANRTA